MKISYMPKVKQEGKPDAGSKRKMKMTDLSPPISIITLNVNVLNTLIKK